MRVGGLPGVARGVCGVGATLPQHRREIGAGGGREDTAAPMRGGGKGGEPGWAPVVSGKELLYVS